MRSDNPNNKYTWLFGMNQKELREALQAHESDLLIAYDRGGMELLIGIWEHLAGIPIYPSKRAYFKLAAMYVRKHYDPANAMYSKKSLAAKLGVSLRSVQIWLDTTDVNDPRQLDAFAKQETE